MNYNLDAFFGLTINFQDICLITPPKIIDIANIGFNTFNYYTFLLTQSQEDIDCDFLNNGDIKDAPTPFIFLMTYALINEELKENIKKAFQFFIKETVTFLPEIQAIVVGDILEKRIINEQNFFDFQNTIRAASGIKLISPPSENLKIRKFKAKQVYRDRVKSKTSKDSVKDLTTLLTSVCCMGVGLNPINLMDISYAALKMMIDRYEMKESYDSQFAISLAGGQTKDNIFWIRDVNT